MIFSNRQEVKFRGQLRQLYQEILGREIDKEGEKYYLKLLKYGTLTMSDVREIITYSPEAKEFRGNRRFNIKTKEQKHYSKQLLFKSDLPKDEIQRLVNSVTWYHTFNFDGLPPDKIWKEIKNKAHNILNYVRLTTENTRTSMEYQMWVAQGIPDDLSGKTVLDIGAADGFYSFLCESRGAKRVVALDFMKWDGFDIAKKILNSSVEHIIMKVEDLNQLSEKFDIVLCFGVYYHLSDPVGAIQKIYDKVNERVYLAGHIANNNEPIMCFYDKYEMHPDDDSNWWAASPSCLIRIAKRVGFKEAKILAVMFQKEMLNFQTDEERNSLRQLGHIGVFEFLK